MHTREQWLEAFKRKNGGLLYWLMQGDDKDVVAKTPGGVCHALTLEWIKSERGMTQRRIAFSNQFSNSLTAPIRIPEDYIKKQLDYHSRVKLAKTTVAEMEKIALTLNRAYKKLLAVARSAPSEANTKAADSANIEAQKAFDALDDYTRETQGGSECLFRKIFEIDTAMYTVLEFIAAKKYAEARPNTFGDEVYCALAMTKSTADGSNLGHMVGLHIGAQTEYFDANIAFIRFKSFSDLRDFVVQEVWGAFYMNDYDTLALYFFDGGLRGTIYDIDEKKVGTTPATTPEQRDKRLTQDISSSKTNKPCVIM